MQLTQISKSRFKAKALEFLRQVETTRESIIITDNGRPTVEVRQYRTDKRPPLERLRGSVVDYAAPTEPVGENDWDALH